MQGKEEDIFSLSSHLSDSLFIFSPFLKELVFNKETNQPGLSNSLHPDRLSPADGEADKDPGVLGDNRLPPTRGQGESWACSSGKGKAKGVPTAAYDYPAGRWREAGARPPARPWR